LPSNVPEQDFSPYPSAEASVSKTKASCASTARYFQNIALENAFQIEFQTQESQIEENLKSLSLENKCEFKSATASETKYVVSS